MYVIHNCIRVHYSCTKKSDRIYQFPINLEKNENDGEWKKKNENDCERKKKENDCERKKMKMTANERRKKSSHMRLIRTRWFGIPGRVSLIPSSILSRGFRRAIIWVPIMP